MKYLTAFLLLTTILAHGQAIYFGTTIGGPSQDIGRSAIQTFDGKYVATGPTSSFGAGSSDVWLVKTDLNGWPRWMHTYGGAGVDWSNYVRETKADSGLIICGYTDSYGNGGYDFYLIKTDSAGTMLWSKTYGGSDWDFGYMVQQTTDGGYILVGGTYSYGAGDEDVYLVKTNSTGDTLWTRHYGGSKQDEGRSVKQTLDGGYVIAGFTKSFGDTTGDAYIIRTNANGDTLWTRHPGGTHADDAHDVIQVSDSSFYFLGGTNSYGTGTDQDMFFGHLSSGGTQLANQHVGSINGLDRGETLLQLNSNLFSLFGSTQSYGYAAGTWDMWMTLCDAYGNYVPGGNTFGDPHNASDEEGYSMVQTSDHGFLLCGYSTGFKTNGIPDFFLLKTDSLADNVPLIAGIAVLPQENLKQQPIYPNPAADRAVLPLGKADTHTLVRLYSTDGRDLSNAILVHTANNELTIDFDRNLLPPGIYFYEVTTGGSRTRGKVILQ